MLTVADAGVKTAREAYLMWVDRGAMLIETIAVLLILGFILFSTADWVARTLFGRSQASELYDRYRQRLGRSLLLGLEILVAADIVRTVALEPTLNNILGLGLLVTIRTFLSWSIILEIEGRWPWQRRAAEPTRPAPAADHAAPS
jgi:uncharacterized membrane protein